MDPWGEIQPRVNGVTNLVTLFYIQIKSVPNLVTIWAPWFSQPWLVMFLVSILNFMRELTLTKLSIYNFTSIVISWEELTYWKNLDTIGIQVVILGPVPRPLYRICLSLPRPKIGWQKLLPHSKASPFLASVSVWPNAKQCNPCLPKRNRIPLAANCK